MKRMMKKLSAIALAGAMVLSLSVTALASSVPDGTPTDQTTIAAAQGNATGTGSTTGGIPQDVLKIKLPLNAAAGTFNLYFDPHNLIRQSNNALELGSADATFADDTLVYFKNAGDSVSFSKTSDPITVINKSSVPISVEMTATWDKTTATYSLAKDADDLANAKANGEAALYLYLEEDHTNGTSPVVEADKGTPKLTADVAETATGGGAGSAKTDLDYLTKYIKSVKFAFTENADAQDIKNINEGDATNNKAPADWTFTFANVNNKTPTVTFTNAATVIPAYVSYNTSGNATNTAYKAVATPNVEISTTNNADGTKSYAVKDGSPKAISVLKIQRGTSLDVATITFEWDYEAIAQNGFAATEVIKDATDPTTKYDTWNLTLAAASGSGAEVKTDLNRVDGAYHLVKDTPTTMKWDLVDGYTYDEGDDNKWQSVSFRLNAAITDGDVCAKAWDTAFPSSITDNELELIWKAVECDAVDPSATVTTPLSSATGNAELAVDWGYGDSKTTTISAASYTINGNATALPLDNVAIDENTVTITSVSALFAEGGANGVITLTFKHADTGYTKDVTVDLKTAAA